MYPSQEFGDSVTANQLDAGASNIERLLALGVGGYLAINDAKARKLTDLKEVANPVSQPAQDAPGLAGQLNGASFMYLGLAAAAGAVLVWVVSRR